MWKDSETNEDLLGYDVHAKMLKDIILDKSMLPISIGIFGNWGSGKSSLMLLLERELKLYQEATDADKKSCKGRILQIRFNSWQFENYENTKYALIDTILRAVVKDVKAHRRTGEKLKKLLGRIDWLSVISLAFSKTKDLIPYSQYIPTLDELKGLLKDEEYEEVQNACKGNRTGSLVSLFRSNFETLVKEAEYRAIVVYIDDLDRCAPERVIECLEAVKLFFQVANTAFIIGADIRIIEYAITQHYPLDKDKPKDAAYSPFSDYLEKLIQLPYKLPKLSRKEQETYILMLLAQQHLPNDYKKILEDYQNFRQKNRHEKYSFTQLKSLCTSATEAMENLVEIIPLMLEFLNGNPRQLKRFLNTLDVRMRLANAAGIGIYPNVLAKLMTLEYNPNTRNQFEDLYDKQMMTGYVEGIEDIESIAINEKQIDENGDWGKWASDSLIKWLACPPSLSNVMLRDYFWISRESLNEITPLENLISARVRNAFIRLRDTQAVSILKNKIPEECKNFDSEEKANFISLLNQALRNNPSDASCWRILNNDVSNQLITPSLDQIKRLLMGVKTTAITPVAKSFFVRMCSDPDVKEYLKEPTFDKKLINAIESR